MSSPTSFLDVPIGQAPSFACEARYTDAGEAWVRLRGELDIAAVSELDATLSEALTRAEAVLVDLRPLSFLDGAGLGALLGARARAGKDGRQVTLIRGDGQFHALLSVTGLDALFETADAAGREPLPADDAAAAPRLCCPRCGLTMPTPAAEPRTEECPRCLGRAGLKIPMAIAS